MSTSSAPPPALFYNRISALNSQFIRYRMNVHKLTDVNKTMDEKAATFDGAMHNSVMCGLSPYIIYCFSVLICRCQQVQCG